MKKITFTLPEDLIFQIKEKSKEFNCNPDELIIAILKSAIHGDHNALYKITKYTPLF